MLSRHATGRMRPGLCDESLFELEMGIGQVALVKDRVAENHQQLCKEFRVKHDLINTDTSKYRLPTSVNRPLP